MQRPTSSVLMARGSRVLLALALSLALTTVSAQATDPLVGRFSDGWMEVTVSGGGGQYNGQIAVGGQTYPFMAQGSAARIDGIYELGGQRYPFSAGLQGEVLILINGDQQFQLARQAAQPAFPAAPAAQPAQLAAPAAQPAQAGQQAASGEFLPAGTRLTYRHAVASNPGTNAGPDARATGGQGYLEIDIFYSDAQLCVAKLKMYTAGLTVNSLTVSMSESIIGEGGICSTYWAPPSVLAAYQAPAGGIQTVQRGPFEFGGRSYNAISIANEYQNNRITRVYDLATGIMLTEVEGSGQRGYAAGGNPDPAGSGVQELISVRQVNLPWSQTEALPASIQNLQSLTYRGEISTSVPGIYMWDSSMVSTFEFKLDVQRRGSTWLLAQTTMNATFPGSNIPQPQTQSQAIVNSVTGYFLPIAVLSALTTGQVIDTDPITGVRTYVERADQNGVVIVNEGRGMKGATTYDPRTGLAVYSTLEQQTDGQNLMLKQELVGTQ